MLILKSEAVTTSPTAERVRTAGGKFNWGAMQDKPHPPRRAIAQRPLRDGASGCASGCNPERPRPARGCFYNFDFNSASASFISVRFMRSSATKNSSS
jgi:hypothetical protein